MISRFAYCENTVINKAAMTDKYVYYFMRPRGPAGVQVLSNRRATLDAIKDKGEAVMESQIVVDHSEVNDNGFVIGGAGSESHATDQRWSQIRSLELRANSRDSAALALDEDSQGACKYMLQLESRELRHQSRKLKEQMAGAKTSEPEDWSGVQNFVQFAGRSRTA